MIILTIVHLQRWLPSRRTYFLQDHQDLETPICSLTTTGECLYTLVQQALCSVEIIVNDTFTCIESIFGYSHKEFLIPRPPRTKFNQPRTHSSASRCTSPANAGARNARGLTNPPHAEL